VNLAPIMSPVEFPSSVVVTHAADLERPPLPPIPTEDVMLEDSRDGLMIADQPDTVETEAEEGGPVQDENQPPHVDPPADVFYAPDSQGIPHFPPHTKIE